MNFNIILSEIFKKEAKKLIKRYTSLKNELAELGEKLQEEPLTGTHLGNNIYKIRLAIKSKNKGKSGGARIISLVKIVEQTVYLITIYNKGEKETISDSEIDEIIKNEDIS